MTVISEAIKSLSIKKANFVDVREKRTKFIFTLYINYMYYMYHRNMMFRRVHDEVHYQYSYLDLVHVGKL